MKKICVLSKRNFPFLGNCTTLRVLLHLFALILTLLIIFSMALVWDFGCTRALALCSFFFLFTYAAVCFTLNFANSLIAAAVTLKVFNVSVHLFAHFSFCCCLRCALSSPTRWLTVWPDMWRCCRAGAGQGLQPQSCGILIWAICNDRPPMSAEEWQVERL